MGPLAMASPCSRRRMVAPSSMPAGIFSWMVCFLFGTPLPLQTVQVFSGILPVPLHFGQMPGCWMLPKMVRVTFMTWPEPLHCVAGFQFIARLRGGAFAVFAGVIKLELQVGFGAEDGLLKADFHAGLHVAAAGLPGPSASAGLAAAEETAEDVAQAQIAEVKVDVLALRPAETAAERIAAGRAAHAGMAELVVALALFGIL